MVESFWVRNPSFSNLFYPENPLQLKTSVERLLIREKDIKKVSFLLVPHAGYIYSGATAGKTFACSEISKRVIIMGPNHTGKGKSVSIWTKGLWKTPLGEISIDEENSIKLIELTGKEYKDREGHIKEHSIEVELPFMQVRYGNFSMVPICVATENYIELKRLGECIAKTIELSKEETTIIVSSDMNHYESAETNKKKDFYAIEAILNLDPEKLYKEVNEKEISMCGYAPAVSALYALNLLQGKSMELIDYSHSGIVTGDYSEVVSYAGIRCAEN